MILKHVFETLDVFMGEFVISERQCGVCLYRFIEIDM